LAEGGNFPAAVKTVGEWFPRSERALATGLFNAGCNIGAVLTPLIVPWIVVKMGWPAAFLITGSLGFFCVVAWMVVYRPPEEHPNLSADELSHIRSDPPDPPAKIPWAELLGYRATWAFIAGMALTPANGELFDFSDIYLGLPGRFVTKTGAIKGFDPDKLAGKTVAVRKGTTHAEFVRRYLPKAKVEEFATEADALAAVSAGEADAYFGDGMRASFWLNDNPGCCGFAGQPYFRPDLFGDGFAVAVPSSRAVVRDVINAALVRLKRDGTMDELYLRWFPVSFY